MKGYCRCCAVAALIALLTAAPSLAQTAVKVGVLNDQSGPYSEYTGAGSVDAARMAIEDFGGKALGRPIELVSGDHQNKPDTALSIAKRWLDTQGVNVIVDVPTSSVALAIQNLMRERKKIVLFSGAGTSELTGKACSPYGVHWTYDSYAIAHAPARAAMQSGLKSWYFVTVDFAFGHALQRDATVAIEAEGGTVLGAVRHPFNMPDFSSTLLTARGANPDIIGVANAGPDMINTLKQAKEFGMPVEGQKIVAFLMTTMDVHGLGLKVAQGALATESFYWDMNDATRAFAKRFFERNGKMPTMIHAGVYGAVTHYLKAVSAAGSSESEAVMQAMRKAPINDMMTKDGTIREDGRVMREFYVFEVKAPGESKASWDYYKLVRTISPREGALPLNESQCDLVKK